MLWIIKMLVWGLFDDIKKNKQNNVEWKYLNRVHNIIWSYDEKNSVKINKLVRFGSESTLLKMWLNLPPHYLFK